MEMERKEKEGALGKAGSHNLCTLEEGTIAVKPQGIYSGGNFDELARKSSIFVDKSLFIKEIIESEDKVTLITMPRRWGKSLNLDMLKRFLSIEINKETGSVIPHIETDNYKLFAGGEIELGFGDTKKLTKLKIADENYFIKRQGQFPVISIDFKDCKAGSFIEIKELVIQRIEELFLKFGYLETSDKIYSGKITVSKQYEELLSNIKSAKDFQNGIKDLSELLYAHHDQKVWILIDEYDAAANDSYRKLDNEEAQKVADLFRTILEPALKGNDNLEKAVITGVQYIVKSGMLSGLNNLAKYSIQNYKYSQYYGVTQEEMDILLSHFNIKDDKRDKIKDWYNGYQEKVTNTGLYIDKYNIWSVVQYLNKQETGFKSYWEESGSIDFLKNLFKRQLVQDKINKLIDGESISFELYTDFSVDNFQVLKEMINLGSNKEINDFGLDILFSYFFITGYLTEDGDGRYKLPNKEIKHEMGKRIVEYYKTIYRLDQDKLKDLTNILQEIIDKTQSFDDKKKKVDFIKESFISKFQLKFQELVRECKLVNDKDSSDGIFANEDVIHSILNYIGIQVVNSSFGSEVYTNKIHSQGKGRVDFTIKNRNTGLIIEVKYGGNADEALAQAKTYENLIHDQEDKIFIGFNISESKNLTLSYEIYIKEDVYNAKT